MKFPPVNKIVEGVDLNSDLLQVFGYLISLGWKEKVMPTEHLIDIHNRFMDLYGNQSPKDVE